LRPQNLKLRNKLQSLPKGSLAEAVGLANIGNGRLQASDIPAWMNGT